MVITSSSVCQQECQISQAGLPIQTFRNEKAWGIRWFSGYAFSFRQRLDVSLCVLGYFGTDLVWGQTLRLWAQGQAKIDDRARASAGATGMTGPCSAHCAVAMLAFAHSDGSRPLFVLCSLGTLFRRTVSRVCARQGQVGNRHKSMPSIHFQSMHAVWRCESLISWV